MSDATSEAAGEPLPLRLLDRVSLATNIVGSTLIFGLMLLIGFDVAGRNLFGAPISGVPEIVSLSIVAIVFLQAPQTLRAGRMPRSTALLDALSKKVPRMVTVMEDLWDLVGMAVLGTIVWATWPRLLREYERGTFVGAVGDFTAPTWPMKATIVVGGALLVLQFAGRIWRRHLARHGALA
ncbi:TRAP transporter small permease subunit [Jannaschia sp. CCS1]|uniref:TRAP transporter small permease subunit n=1 Tax=Jannaschia sp. (strain CCS1) TaxID=290400 RepID=UPI000053B2BC|nr:TRAP transporter small permease [Jannaschia sp. CCS1]ABD54953.1 TRAP dicarboxylate transporter DctQ subunit [Jannaschia sp. CCS1]